MEDGDVLTDKHAENQSAPDIRSCILTIYTSCKKHPGTAKIRAMLIREYSIYISQGRACRLMKGMTLPKMSASKPVNKTQKNPDVSEKSNILKQNFSQRAPNKTWVSDFTYIKADGKWFYLCVVIDLFSHNVIGWEFSSKPDDDLVISAFKKAWSERKCPEGLMFHSDQGAQYKSKAFRKLLDSCGVLQSFSKKGYPYDNAVFESI